jgi:hypothetical protein
MKILLTGLVCLNLFVFTALAQNVSDTTSSQNKESDILLVEASCGQCNFKLPGQGCDLAVRMNGKAYFVDGTKIDDHGNAHASDGFCSTIRKAHVKGTVVDNRFKATYFELIED